MTPRLDRRLFLASSSAASAAMFVPYVFTSAAEKPQSASDKLGLGAIGVGGRGLGHCQRRRQPRHDARPAPTSTAGGPRSSSARNASARSTTTTASCSTARTSTW